MFVATLKPNLLRWWPLVLLILAGAGRWMVVDVRPESASTLGSEALGCVWAALFLVVPLVSAGRGAVSGVLRDSRGLLSGAMLLGGPACALLVRGTGMDAIAMTMALALTPVVIAIASSALGEQMDGGIAGRIWPGLAAVSGLLLVLVQPSLGDVRSDVGLVLVPLLTGVGAALFCSQREANLQEGNTLKRHTVRGVSALLGALALFAVSALVYRRSGVHMVAVAWDGVMALLGVVALGKLGAARWSSQFAVVPLLVLVEGMVLVRQGLTVRWGIGLALLMAASVRLVLPEDEE